jgi:flagellar biosynthesis protein FlhB
MILGKHMNWIAELQNINYIAVAIATIASYLLGFVWYHWAVFGEAWANALSITKEEADNTEGLGGAFIVSLVSGLTKSLCVALLMAATNISGVLNGAFFGAVVAVVFIVTSLGYYNGFARIPSKITLINSTHSIVEITLVGAIIGTFI